MAIGGKKKGRIMSSEELSSFCDQIALMLSSGMTLRDGIEMLAEDEMKDKSLKNRPYTNLYKVVDGEERFFDPTAELDASSKTDTYTTERWY